MRNVTRSHRKELIIAMTSADPVLEVFLLSFIVRTINVELENIWKTRNPENFVWAEYLGCPPKVVAVSLLGRDDT